MNSSGYSLPTLLLTAMFVVAGCGGAPLSQISLMPAPEVYEEGKIDPFLDNDPISRGLQPQVLYATDRAPAAPDDEDGARYTDDRGGVLRLGVASELWHFLGYQGAFIAFSWPSTPSTFAYFSDLEDAAVSGRSLRSLILHIAENTAAERIHVLGYSAGTRVVTRMLADLGMYGYLLDRDELRRRVKLGNVILVGSDVDQEILAGYVLDGALRVPDAITIYQSKTDKALGMSRFVFGRNRSGQAVAVSRRLHRPPARRAG